MGSSSRTSSWIKINSEDVVIFLEAPAPDRSIPLPGLVWIWRTLDGATGPNGEGRKIEKTPRCIGPRDETETLKGTPV